MTPEVFFKNLDLTAIVRKSTEKEKPVKLEVMLKNCAQS